MDIAVIFNDAVTINAYTINKYTQSHRDAYLMGRVKENSRNPGRAWRYRFHFVAG